jgi:hypothetical protein
MATSLSHHTNAVLRRGALALALAAVTAVGCLAVVAVIRAVPYAELSHGANLSGQDDGTTESASHSALPAGEVDGGPLRSASATDLDSQLEEAGAVRPALGTLSPAVSEDRDHELIRQNVELLKTGRQRFGALPGYSATFIKRERVASQLNEEERVLIKVRHAPFSVYMKWLERDAGKEVLYVAGTNSGEMLVRLGGVKGRLLPVFSVDPNGSMAMKQSRYPVTRMGVLSLADTLIDNREQELRDGIVANCSYQPDASSDGRPCHLFVLEFDNPAQSPVYRKSIQYIDRRWNIPVEIVNFTWPEPNAAGSGPSLDDETLIEYYKYSDIDAGTAISDADFDRANADYRLRR